MTARTRIIRKTTAPPLGKPQGNPCLDCGALITDWTLHNWWHDQYDRLLAVVSVMEHEHVRYLLDSQAQEHIPTSGDTPSCRTSPADTAQYWRESGADSTEGEI